MVHILAALVFVLVFAVASPAHAALVPVGEYCEANNYGFVTCVVTYIQTNIQTAAYYFFSQIYPVISDTITYAIELAIILFGVLAAYGMIEKVARESTILILKIGVILYFINNVPEIYDWLIGAMDDLIDIVSNFVTLKNLLYDDAMPLHCGFTLTVWQRLDCLLDVVVGVSTEGMLSSGMLAFFFHNMTVGSMGVLIGILGIWMMISFISAIFTAIWEYLMAFLTITLMMILGGLFIPLILFKGSYNFFEGWVRKLIGAILIPVIVFAFLNIVLTAFDIVLYSGEHSVLRTFSGDAVDEEGYNVNQYIDTNDILEEDNSKGPIMQTRQTQFQLPFEVITGGEYPRFGAYCDETSGRTCSDEQLYAIPGAVNSIPLGIPMARINYGTAASVAGMADGPTLMKEVLAAMVVAALIAYILINMLKFVPGMAHDLAGVKAGESSGGSGSPLPGTHGASGAGHATSGVKTQTGGLAGHR